MATKRKAAPAETIEQTVSPSPPIPATFVRWESRPCAVPGGHAGGLGDPEHVHVGGHPSGSTTRTTSRSIGVTPVRGLLPYPLGPGTIWPPLVILTRGHPATRVEVVDWDWVPDDGERVYAVRSWEFWGPLPRGADRVAAGGGGGRRSGRAGHSAAPAGA